MVDNDGDGSLTQEEFIAALSLPNVQRYLTSLDVRIQEPLVVYSSFSSQPEYVDIFLCSEISNRSIPNKNDRNL